MGKKTKILLHTCCAPCGSGALEKLQAAGYEPVLFFSNSNIFPRDEYDKRLESARSLVEQTGVELIVDGYNHTAWREWISRLPEYEKEPEGGRRCTLCFRFSLDRTAAKAAELGIALFTTTLTISPHKDSLLIFTAGRESAGGRTEGPAEHPGITAPATQTAGISTPRFVEIDFKREDGFQRSVELSRLYKLYRQRYCGCEYSRG